MYEIDLAMNCFENCIKHNNLIYLSLLNNFFIKDYLKENDDSEYYFEIKLKDKYGLRIANQSQDKDLIDIILIRWIGDESEDIYCKNVMDSINRVNNIEYLIKEINRIIKYFEKNKIKDCDIILV